MTASTQTRLQYHPAANLFPLMDGDEYSALVADIREHGQREPIWLHEDGSIIDGRNRYRACIDIGIDPKTKTWPGSGSLVSFVVSLNLKRRHLTKSQQATICVDMLPLLEEEARVRMERGRPKKGRAIMPEVLPGFDAEANRKLGAAYVAAGGIKDLSPAGRAREHAAKIVGVSPRYVEDAKSIKEKSPELFSKVRTGEKTITEAKREIKEQRRDERREENRQMVLASKSPTELVGRFATIVIDPPWDWGDEGDIDQLGRAKPIYETMPLEKVAELPVSKLADVDCHLYLWITNRSLPKGFALLERWGFRYVTCLTWCKPSIGMGNYFRGSTEHVLFAVRGSQPIKRKNVGTWFQAPRGKAHSEKPIAFFELIESCSPGPFLEMFARGKRDGWSSWGAEAK